MWKLHVKINIRFPYFKGFITNHDLFVAVIAYHLTYSEMPSFIGIASHEKQQCTFWFFPIYFITYNFIRIMHFYDKHDNFYIQLRIIHHYR